MPSRCAPVRHGPPVCRYAMRAVLCLATVPENRPLLATAKAVYLLAKWNTVLLEAHAVASTGHRAYLPSPPHGPTPLSGCVRGWQISRTWARIASRHAWLRTWASLR